MPSANYLIVRDAIQNQQQIVCSYQGHPRELCPHILGKTNGEERLLAWQFGGRTSGSLPAGGAWKCLNVAAMRDIKARDGGWYTGAGHRTTQTCVQDIDLDIDVRTARDNRPPRVGTAGWAIRKEYGYHFPGSGSHLERYARRFNAVEINSSFYRRGTYERWAASVPDDFAFAVKIPKEITHTRRLSDTASPLDAFLDPVAGLGAKLGVLLVQLPPRLEFDLRVAQTFLATFRARFAGNIALEPRHASWFSPAAEELLIDHWTARVAADPAILPDAAESGGWPDIRYYRLHGSPRMYYSRYEADRIAAYAERVRAAGAWAWCILDNTADAGATENALELSALLA